VFCIQISVSIIETISVICFICISVWHQYLNNFFGEFIIQKVRVINLPIHDVVIIYLVIYVYVQQLSVYTVSYNVPWWRCNKRVRHLLALMILRSIKPTFITGFYMYKLSYESFISVRLFLFYIFLFHIKCII